MVTGVVFLFKKQKGNDILTLVNTGRHGRAGPRSGAGGARPRAKAQMRPAAFSCTLYSLFFFTRQLMKKSSSVPSTL